jgi:hypothetical protein
MMSPLLILPSLIVDVIAGSLQSSSIIADCRIAMARPARSIGQLAGRANLVAAGGPAALAESGFDRKLKKINRVDTLLHERFLPFDEFARLALAELAIACRATRARLDPRSSLLIFADHGFRLSADGRSYHHGGTSTLEQLVPILHLTPR